jgi:hypothetical protein
LQVRVERKRCSVVKVLNIAQDNAGYKIRQGEKEDIKSVLNLPPQKDWWLVDVGVSSKDQIRLVRTDQHYVALSFSYGFNYKKVGVVVGTDTERSWLIPETLIDAISQVRITEHKFLWTDFFNDSPIEARINRSLKNPDAQWSRILFGEYENNKTFYYGLVADDMNYITRIWIMQELAAGYENSIADISWCPVLKLVDKTSHPKKLQLAVAWGLMSIGMFGVGGARSLDMLRVTAIKATSGFVGKGSDVELERIYSCILADGTQIYRHEDQQEMLEYITALMDRSKDLAPVDKLLVKNVVEAVFTTIAEKDTGQQYLKLLGMINNQGFQLTVPRYIDDRSLADKLSKEELNTLAQPEQQQEADQLQVSQTLAFFKFRFETVGF